MCYRNDYVYGDRDRRNRRDRFICDCREVRGRGDGRYGRYGFHDHCNCHDCRRRRNDFICRCRER